MPHQIMYDARFFESQSAGSRQSADVIVALIIDIVQPTSVVDIGCGVGTWLACFIENGIDDVIGVDGPYVDESLLQFPARCFVPHDLIEPPPLARKFDLALCLEVAEHLGPKYAAELVSTVTSLSSAVLFSAAIPGQGGVGHVNEQWPDYWETLFAERDYRSLDVIRPQVWRNPRVDPWYAQNTFLYVHASRDDLCGRTAEMDTLLGLPIVHPSFLGAKVALVEELYASEARRETSPRIRSISRVLRNAGQAAAYRLSRFRGAAR